MKLKHWLFVLLLLIFFTGCNTPVTTRSLGKDSTSIYTVESEDGVMNAAILEAQISLRQFDTAMASNNSSYSYFDLKVRYNYGERGESGEHIWFREIQKKNGVYTGIVDNVPEHIDGLHLNDTVTINQKNISDWMYLENGVLRGGFTMRVLYNRMTPEEKRSFDSTNFYKIEDK